MYKLVNFIQIQQILRTVLILPFFSDSLEIFLLNVVLLTLSFCIFMDLLTILEFVWNILGL